LGRWREKRSRLDGWTSNVGGERSKAVWISDAPSTCSVVERGSIIWGAQLLAGAVPFRRVVPLGGVEQFGVYEGFVRLLYDIALNHYFELPIFGIEFSRWEVFNHFIATDSRPLVLSKLEIGVQG
jgi:hypothetical protein